MPKSLTDKDPFPFGKYKGVPMGEVPAHYLDWLRDQPWLRQFPDVAEYIQGNTKAIDEELKNK